MEGSKSFPCDLCAKICKSKGGLTRHRRSKHEEASTTSVSKKYKKQKIDMPVLEGFCKEIAEKIREENIYPEKIIKIVEGLKPSEQFLKSVSEVFSSLLESVTKMLSWLNFMEKYIKIGKAFFQLVMIRSQLMFC